MPQGQPSRRQSRCPGANWVHLKFGSYDFGEKSYAVITSLEDGGSQRLDAGSVSQYRNRSASFNGNTVTEELFVEP